LTGNIELSDKEVSLLVDAVRARIYPDEARGITETEYNRLSDLMDRLLKVEVNTND